MLARRAKAYSSTCSQTVSRILGECGLCAAAGYRKNQ